MTTAIPSRSSIRASVVTDMRRPNPVLSTSITRRSYDALERIARSRFTSKSALMRELIEQYVARNGHK